MMSEQYSVWTYNRTPEWLTRNTVPDMMLVHGVSLHNAHMARERIALITEETVEIRNNADEIVVTREVVTDPATNPEIVIVDTFPRPEQQTERKARRKLGGGAPTPAPGRAPHPDPRKRRELPTLNREL